MRSSRCVRATPWRGWRRAPAKSLSGGRSTRTSCACSLSRTRARRTQQGSRRRRLSCSTSPPTLSKRRASPTAPGCSRARRRWRRPRRPVRCPGARWRAAAPLPPVARCCLLPRRHARAPSPPPCASAQVAPGLAPPAISLPCSRDWRRSRRTSRQLFLCRVRRARARNHCRSHVRSLAAAYLSRSLARSLGPCSG